MKSRIRRQIPGLVLQIWPFAALSWTILFACVASCTGQLEPVDSEAASLAGTIRYEGLVQKNPNVDEMGRRRPLLEVNPANAGVKDCLVLLVPAEPAVQLPAHAPNPEPVQVTQRDYTFLPHLLAIAPGQAMIFGNEDAANHNIRAESRNPRNAFNVITTPDQDFETTINAEPEPKPIRLACDIHPWMAGWIYVLDHTLFAITDTDGQFNIGEIPQGSYTLYIEQPDGNLRAKADLNAKAGSQYELSATFNQNDLEHPAVALTESQE